MMTRRTFVATAAATLAWASRQARAGSLGTATQSAETLRELPPGSVRLTAATEQQQCAQTQATLAALEDDSLLEPFRKLGGVPAPGLALAGWYGSGGWAPGHCLGQWMSAMLRVPTNAAGRARVEQLISQLTSMGPALQTSFHNNAFPAYTYDKLLLGLMDAHASGVGNAMAAIGVLTDAAEPSLPPHALDRAEMCIKPPGEHDVPSCLDENYTLPENQFLAWHMTGDPRYLARAKRFLLDGQFFDRLARGDNALIKQHAYSHMNALSSGLAAYRNGLGDKYLRAVTNAFAMIEQQSYPTGGWGPEEEFIDPKSDRLFEDLTATHRGFETPCGAYAHFKLTRRLLCITGDPHYGDSMERVHFNTVLGALPLETDGRAFYYSDYHLDARKTYFPDRWPCCGGTLPMVAADYWKNIYFASGSGVAVNMYQPSRVEWLVAGRTVSVTQETRYPDSPDITLRVNLARPAQFPLRLRVPAWAAGAEVSTNGRQREAAAAGSFHLVSREWHDGDRVELHLPLAVRTQPLSARHPEYVTLMRGPSALFRRRPDGKPVSRAELMAGASDASRYAPFPAIPTDEAYALFQRMA